MKPFRVEKVASTVREVISDAIANRLSDPRISAFTSVTRVKVSGDLQTAKVYVSVMGPEGEQNRSVSGLRHATGHVQALLARRLRTRHCPRIQFVLDDSIKKATETIRLIGQSAAEFGPAEQAAPPREQAEQEEDTT